ncbi:coiled-coil domain-containing protein 130 [[Emmonsia] crescens]|uniref:Coiled-coil domain-containing protein 130 n=1 Tax=[Emmonsia] crescens TaxID=73230 RepID=A0A2B7Z5W3_9EURO|nr:coiled-coil domain-containing protein 130 [Emmonsia crescens]
MQGFNMGRYVPPDQEGLTTGNKLANKHPLGSRARHLHTTGELTVRFEMPFAVWCSTCKPADSVLIGQGVRFNALKKRVGSYYSTPIYSFRMKHTVCGGWIEIRTDPQNTAYVVTEGGRRRDTGELEKGGYEEDGEITLRISHGAGAGDSAEKDAFSKLEGKVADQKRVMTEKARMEELRKRQGRDWEDPYEQSRRLRRAFRAERKRREAAQGATEALQDRMSLGIELLEESDGDRARAGMVDFAPVGDNTVGGAVARRVITKPLFETKSLPATPPDRGRGKKGKRPKKPEVIAAERKALLQQELSGNTRAAVDPFLLDDNSDWTPGVKRRRIVGSANVVPAEDGPQQGRKCGGVEDRDGGGGDGGGETPNAVDGNGPLKLTAMAADEEASIARRVASAKPLVGYGWSDDSD